MSYLLVQSWTLLFWVHGPHLLLTDNIFTVLLLIESFEFLHILPKMLRHYKWACGIGTASDEKINFVNNELQVTQNNTVCEALKTIAWYASVTISPFIESMKMTVKQLLLQLLSEMLEKKTQTFFAVFWPINNMTWKGHCYPLVLFLLTSVCFLKTQLPHPDAIKNH